MEQPWAGKHIWIWQLSQVGNAAAVIEKAKDLGLTGILIKGWDSGNFREQINTITGPAKAAGLIVGVWGYSYGNNPEGEAAAAKKAVAAGADWLVVDAEVEYEQRLGSTQALQLGKALRAAVGQSFPIGYTSFAIPSYHPIFPYSEFSSWCNITLPQVYWGSFRMPVAKAFSLTLSGMKSYGLPVAPVGQSYGPALPKDIVLFGDLAAAAGLPGISYYDWQHATSEQLRAVGQARCVRRDIVSDWAKDSWNKAVKAGVLDGTDPQGTVTREMLAVIIDRLGLLDAYTVPQEVVDALMSRGIITSHHPTGARVTWGELASVITRLHPPN